MSLPDRFDEFVASVSAPAVCGHEGCGRPGEMTLQITLWARGRAKGSHDPMVCHMTLRRCPSHCWEVKPESFWLPESRAMISRAVRAAGRAEPDFDTAEFTWVKAATALGGGLSVN